MNAPPEAVFVGASAGSVHALMQILPLLPEDFQFPVVVVVHLPPAPKSIMCEIFSAKCFVKVKEAEDKERLEPGTVYFAPADYHLLVEADQTFSLSCDDPVLYSRPSIDVLFESAADAYGDKALGIVLTGANEDGTRGLRAICDAGGGGIVQDASQALAPQMPAMALKRCPTAMVLTLEEIAQYLIALHKSFSVT